MSSRRKTAPPSPSPSRAAAFRVLKAVEEGASQPAASLERHGTELSGLDRDLATELVYGVLRWQLRLDHIMQAFMRRAPESLDATVRLCLRLGLYQLRFLERVPHHAAVDESVRLAKAFGASRGAGFVNAVLRSALRRPDWPPAPPGESGLIPSLAVETSHPEWLVRRYVDRLGRRDAEKRLRVQNLPPPVYLRITARIDVTRAREALTADGLEVEPVPEAPRGFRITGGRFRGSRLDREGLAHIQDLGSQLIPYLLDVASTERVLDVCAAPGGKATLIAEQASEGRVLAVDLRPTRARSLRALATHLLPGSLPLDVVVADGRRLPVASAFPKILLDVPCSNLGTLRRNPDLKWKAHESELGAFSRRQRELLDAAARALAPGGRLVYATCSTEPEENETVVEAFLRKHGGFRRARDLIELLPEASRRFVTASGSFETRPERDETDGYFACALLRAP